MRRSKTTLLDVLLWVVGLGVVAYLAFVVLCAIFCGSGRGKLDFGEVAVGVDSPERITISVADGRVRAHHDGDLLVEKELRAAGRDVGANGAGVVAAAGTAALQSSLTSAELRIFGGDIFYEGPHLTCGDGSLFAEGKCDFQVVFKPASEGRRGGRMELFVGGDAIGVVDLSGIGVEPDPPCTQEELLALEADVGSQDTRTGTIFCETAEEIDFDGLDDADEVFKLNSHQCEPVEGGQECDVTVTFTPRETKVSTGLVRILPEAGVGLSGLGFEKPAVTVAPSPVLFEDGPVGGVQSDPVVTVTNDGPGAVTWRDIVVGGRDFTLADEDCRPVLEAGTTCTIRIEFTAIEGSSAGVLRLFGSGPSGTPIIFTAELGGAGFPSDISVTPSPIDFGVVTVGTVSEPMTVTLSVDGGPVELGEAATVSEFAIESSTCLGTQTDSCEIAISFSPRSVGPAVGFLDVPGAPRVLLSGTGRPRVTADPPVVSFEILTPGSGSATPQTVTVTNHGPDGFEFTDIAVGDADDGFSLNPVGTTCVEEGDLAEGGTCTVTVGFKPPGIGDQVGELVIRGNSLDVVKESVTILVLLDASCIDPGAAPTSLVGARIGTANVSFGAANFARLC